MQAYGLESVQFIAGSTKVIICEALLWRSVSRNIFFHVHPLQFPQSRFCSMRVAPRIVGFQCDQSNLEPISRNGIRRYSAESIVLLVKWLHHDIWSGGTQAITTPQYRHSLQMHHARRDTHRDDVEMYCILPLSFCSRLELAWLFSFGGRVGCV